MILGPKSYIWFSQRTGGFVDHSSIKFGIISHDDDLKNETKYEPS